MLQIYTCRILGSHRLKVVPELFNTYYILEISDNIHVFCDGFEATADKKIANYVKMMKGTNNCKFKINICVDILIYLCHKFSS